MMALYSFTDSGLEPYSFKGDHVFCQNASQFHSNMLRKQQPETGGNGKLYKLTKDRHTLNSKRKCILTGKYQLYHNHIH